MQAVAERYITEAEYWALEEGSAIKHEYFDGRLYAMAGGSNRHAVLCTNAAAILFNQLRGGPCRAVGSEQRVKIEATGLQTYPDVSVYCAPARFTGPNHEVLLNPKLIIEVLSPSTEAYDRSDKFDSYKQLASLHDYVLIAQDRARIEHFHHLESGDWLLHTANTLDDTIRLDSIGCTLPLREVYDGVELATGPLPLRAPIPDAEA